MNRDELEDYVDRSRRLLESAPQMDEQNTQRKLIEPLLEVLGWDMLSPDVELEYSVQMGVGTKKVDYALQIEDTPVVFVEAKGADTSISSGHVDQLTSYLRQTGVDWGMLTNGREFRLFKRKQNSDRPAETSLGVIQLEDLGQRFRLLRALSKESIEAGESESIAENIETNRQAAEELRENKETISRKVARTVTNEIGDGVSQTVEDGAKEFIDVLASNLESQSQSELSFEGPSPSGSPPGQKSWTPGPNKNAITGTISRAEISGPDDSKVAIFPTRESGVKFLKENNAWGFVRVGQKPDFAAFYVARGPQEIRYFATIDEIVPATEATLAREASTYTGDEAGFDPNDQVVVFQPGSLYELADPIKYKNKAPQGRVYTNLGRFKAASTTEDVI